jgi:hypothetical protein
VFLEGWASPFYISIDQPYSGGPSVSKRQSDRESRERGMEREGEREGALSVWVNELGPLSCISDMASFSTLAPVVSLLLTSSGSAWWVPQFCP